MLKAFTHSASRALPRCTQTLSTRIRRARDTSHCNQDIDVVPRSCVYQRRSNKSEQTKTLWFNGIENRVIGDSLPIPLQWIRAARNYAHTKGCNKVYT